MKPTQQRLHDTKTHARRVDTLHTFTVKIKGARYTIHAGYYDSVELLSVDILTSDLRKSVKLSHFKTFTDPHEIRAYFSSLDALKLWIRKNVKQWHSKRATLSTPFISALVNADLTGLTENEAERLNKWEREQVTPFSVEVISVNFDAQLCDVMQEMNDRTTTIKLNWRA